GLLIFLSFYFYGAYAKRLIYEQNRELGKQLVHAAFVQAHSEIGETVQPGSPASDSTKGDLEARDRNQMELHREVNQAGQRYGTKSRADTIYPPNPYDYNLAQTTFEKQLMPLYSSVVLPPEEESAEPITEDNLPKELAPRDEV